MNGYHRKAVAFTLRSFVGFEQCVAISKDRMRTAQTRL